MTGFCQTLSSFSRFLWRRPSSWFWRHNGVAPDAWVGFLLILEACFGRGCFCLAAWICSGLRQGQRPVWPRLFLPWCLNLVRSSSRVGGLFGQGFFCLDAWIWTGLCQGSKACLAIEVVSNCQCLWPALWKDLCLLLFTEYCGARAGRFRFQTFQAFFWGITSLYL